MWVVVGLATAALGLAGLPEVSIWVLVGGLGISLVVAFWYSYVVWRDDPDKEPTGR
jgi:membrane associated rhomboid family serine protease